MKPLREAYGVDPNRLIEHRFKSRLIVFATLLGLYMLFLVLAPHHKHSTPIDTTLIHLMFGGFLIFTILICFIFSTPAERTVIILTEDRIKCKVDGDTWHTFLFDEIGELKEFSSGFIIIKKGTVVTSTFYHRSNFEHRPYEGIIYVPNILNGYWELYTFLEKVMEARKIR